MYLQVELFTAFSPHFPAVHASFCKTARPTHVRFHLFTKMFLC